MFEVLDKICIRDKYAVSVKGDRNLLRNGLKLIDEKGNEFIVESVGMVHYKNIQDMWRFAELILKGNVDDIGKILKIINLTDNDD